jgi:ABC-type branched-subunit amino acid transport system substrate-binding protein
MRSCVLRVVGLLALLAPLAGCPKTLELRPADIGTSSPGARAAWTEAERARAAGDVAASRRKLEELTRIFPEDRLGRAAELELARLERQAGRLADAQKRLAGLAERSQPGTPEADRVNHERGLVAYGLGDMAGALQYLGPLVERLPGAEAQSVAALLGEAARKQGQPAEALRWFGLAQAGGGEAEQAYVAARVRRLRAQLAGRGDGGASASTGGATGAAAAGAPLRIGLIAPLGGRSRLIGERALRGALLALQMAREEGLAAAELVVRDEGDAARSTAAVNELAAAGVSAVVGPFGSATAHAAAQAAASRGLPLLTASTAERLDGLGQTTFRLVPAHRARAAAIASVLQQARARAAMLIGPGSGFGRRMVQALQAELPARGVGLAGVVTTAAGAANFLAEAKGLAHRNFDALVILDSARQLSLWAPALARVGLWTSRSAQAAQAAGATGARTITLVATADGADATLVRESGRYLQGAILVPGYAADPAHPAQRAFVDRYRRELGADPGLVDAVVFEAVSQVARWAQPAPALLGRLRAGDAGGSSSGVLGPLGFRGGERTAPPLTVTIDGDHLRVR